jgi:hypothetical protein
MSTITELFAEVRKSAPANAPYITSFEDVEAAGAVWQGEIHTGWQGNIATATIQMTAEGRAAISLMTYGDSYAAALDRL